MHTQLRRRETTEKEKLADRVRQLENEAENAVQAAMDVVQEQQQCDFSRRERERGERDWFVPTPSLSHTLTQPQSQAQPQTGWDQGAATRAEGGWASVREL